MSQYLGHVSFKGGYAECMDKWGHGRSRSGDWYGRPATIIVEDGDGHSEAWKVRGKIADAALALAAGGCSANSGDFKLWVFNGRTLYPVDREEWAEGVEEIDYDEDGDEIGVRQFPERHPGGIMIG